MGNSSLNKRVLNARVIPHRERMRDQRRDVRARHPCFPSGAGRPSFAARVVEHFAFAVVG